MITDSFDLSKPVISPEDLLTPGYFADKCIATFSRDVLNLALSKYAHTLVANCKSVNGDAPIYMINVNGEDILIYMSPITAAIAAGTVDEVRYKTGAKKFIVFGSCGSLDNELTDGKVIVPTESYRDEGFSYHFRAPSDYIEIKNHGKLSAIFDKHGIPYVNGKSWTTDAIYMETENKVRKHKADGCICVEMESSAIQAVCDFRGIDFYTFFFASDVVDAQVWKNDSLGNEREVGHQSDCFEIALTVALEI